MTKETINILKSLLKGLSVNPLDPGAEQDVIKVKRAMQELEEMEAKETDLELPTS